jgi:hypothetical protein
VGAQVDLDQRQPVADLAEGLADGDVIVFGLLRREGAQDGRLHTVADGGLGGLGRALGQVDADDGHGFGLLWAVAAWGEM